MHISPQRRDWHCKSAYGRLLKPLAYSNIGETRAYVKKDVQNFFLEKVGVILDSWYGMNDGATVSDVPTIDM